MHIYNVMFGGVPARPTGLATSVLRRARALANSGHSFEILVSEHSPNFEDSVQTLEEEGALADGRIKLRSMHYDLAGIEGAREEHPYSSPLGRAQNGWSYVQDPKRSDIWRGSQDGDYKHFVWMRDDKVAGIDTLRSGKRTKRTWYDSGGRACKVERMTPENKPHLIEYLDHSGNIYLQESKSPETGAITNIAMHTSKGIRNFSALSSLIDYWFHEIVFKGVVGPTVISEYGFHRASLQELEKRNAAAVIYTFHNNHHTAPYGASAPLRPEQRDFFKHLKEYKALVLLTEEQRKDIVDEFGCSDILHVIPHHMPRIAIDRQLERDPNRIVMVGRFDAIKGHAHVFKAFAHVVKCHPQATLSLFGRGPEESRLRDLAKSLGLSDSIHFRGFTADAFSEFSRAAISVVASSYEGFCLSLAESMTAGCVPVSWNFRYGPNDLITHERDGLLVEAGDISGLAESLISLLQDPQRRQRMSAAAREISDRLSEDQLIESWNELMSAAHSRS
ncbi:glycosyltransferase [Arthrobacter sp. zg-Y1219]|uniref:glycosyltransferase n=1 Tax=Arthrobacter sp. zg-Y1219 TaxID=3049067 RepID=UPI0024C4042D|nr:glycosyltransferase [Arthrobacter sp. zg-Y1219]MDK1359314.1 glycosyltransferase [Arthrobacter sp. zg-Y1219]